MPTRVRDLFDLPEQIRKGDFVHRLSEGVLHAAETASTYVVTSPIAAAFDRALGLVGSALRDGAWDLLPPVYRDEHRTWLRRDLQRHAILARGEAVPPSPVLDEAWRACGNPAGEVLRLASRAGVCSGFLEGLVATREDIERRAVSTHELSRIER